jgi:two-component system sensor histidine kinase ChvG
VQGRETPIGQVFRNLIDNARSFSPPTARCGSSSATIHGRVITMVADRRRRPGIPPENLETIFERFYTSRPKGTAFGGNSGLGLSIARQIVEAHGGTITGREPHGREGEVIGARFRARIAGSAPTT